MWKVCLKRNEIDFFLLCCEFFFELIKVYLKLFSAIWWKKETENKFVFIAAKSVASAALFQNFDARDNISLVREALLAKSVTLIGLFVSSTSLQQSFYMEPLNT